MRFHANPLFQVWNLLCERISTFCWNSCQNVKIRFFSELWVPQLLLNYMSPSAAYGKSFGNRFYSKSCAFVAMFVSWFVLSWLRHNLLTTYLHWLHVRCQRNQFACWQNCVDLFLQLMWFHENSLIPRLVISPLCSLTPRGLKFR